MRKLDVIGKRFGKLVVIKQGPHFGKTIGWLCRCDCGNETNVRSISLYYKTKSCGCLEKENLKRLAEANKTHGLTEISEYRAWSHAKARCHCPTDKKYRIYGARGITMCPEWLNSFQAFLADMGSRPKGYCLDRIDNNIGYSPENCRWVTLAESSRHTRRVEGY